MIEQLIFDWGGTIMIDYAFPGPMYLWDRVDWVPGAKQYFSAFFSSKELEHGKPDPRFFTAIAEKLQVKTWQCVMIGDRYAKDIEGAKSAGMNTIFYNDKKLPGPFPAADIVIDDMGDLVGAVNMMKCRNEGMKE